MPAPARRLALPAVALAALVAVAAAPASAAPILLEDGVAFLEIDPESPDGATGWTVNGVAHVRSAALFVRAGDDASEQSLDALDFLAATPSDADGDGHDETLDLAYADPAGRFEMTLRWTLSGTPIAQSGGAVGSDLVLDLILTGHGEPLDVDLFEYVDVDLFGSYADDEALFDIDQPPTSGRAGVTDSSGLGAYEAVWILAPETFEAALYDTTLASLQDASPTALSNALAAAGDVTLAAAWTAPVGGDRKSYTNRWTQSIHVVPEPATLLLVAAGVAFLAARRESAR